MTQDGLWSYAVRVHARPGVEALLIELQDAHGQCVSFLLWALWLSAEDRAPQAARLAEAALWARTWSNTALEPLRRVRRDLKRRLANEPDAARERLRQQVAAVELEAERMLLEMLEAASPQAGAGRIDPVEALQTAVAAWGQEAPDASLRRLASLAA